MKAMRRMALVLATLVLCLSMLTSCGSLVEDVTVKATDSVLDSIQAEFEAKGYEVDRADEYSLQRLNEDAPEMFGEDFQGKITDSLNCDYEEDGMRLSVEMIALTNPADAALVEDYLNKWGAEFEEREGYVYEVTNMGWIVGVTYGRPIN